MKIGIIGHFGGDKKCLDGQTIKTKEINKYLESYFKIKTFKFDTYKQSKNPFKLISMIIKTLKNNDIIIVILSIRGYKIITPILMFFNIFYKRRLFDIVVGSRYYIYNKNNLITKLSKKYEIIFVETDIIKNEYLKRSISNVDVLNNFKHLNKGKYNKTKDKIKVCVFSRIIKEKGIDEAIQSIIKANQILNKNIFELDIYGQIGEKYKREFNNIMSECPKYIKYKGLIDYNKSVDVLNKYDLMLFLTYYKNEGFAGTIVDALYAGLPVIATNWNSNFEILKEDYTGVCVKVNDIDEVSNKLIGLYKDKKKIDNMKKNCLKESEKYNPDRIMKKFVDRLEKDK